MPRDQLSCRASGELLPGQQGGRGLPALRSREAVRDGYHGGRDCKLSGKDMIKTILTYYASRLDEYSDGHMFIFRMQF